MTKNEFVMFAKALKTFYPKESLLPDKEAMSLWYGVLNDLQLQPCLTFLNKWVSTSPFPPSISDIRKGVSAITSPPVTDWGDAWNKVRRAIDRYGFMQKHKAFETFDELTRDAVDCIGWEDICMTDVSKIETLRAQFRQIYDAQAKRKEEKNAMSAGLKEDIARLNGQSQKELNA